MSEFNDVKSFLSGNKKIPQFDDYYANQALAHQNQLTKPFGSLGRLEDFAIWMAGWQRKIKPTMDNPHCLIFAGNHGVCDQKVNSFPQNITLDMIKVFRKGGAAINQLCKGTGVNLKIIPIDINFQTNDITNGPAMNESEFLFALNKGFSAVKQKTNLIILGEMGIGNSTIASAISS